jgi:hypothetical protein
MKNIIFVCSSNTYRIEVLTKYYNILNEETNQKIHFILDDRKINKKDYLKVLNNCSIDYDYSFTTDMIEKLDYLFKDCPYFDEILNKLYGVSIKLLVFIYAKKCLDISKSMILDDDVLIYGSIDKHFESDYVVKHQQFKSIMKTDPPEPLVQGLVSVFGQKLVDEFNTGKHLIGSGNLIYTYKEKHKLVEDVQKFFSSKTIYDLLVAGEEKRIRWGRPRIMGGLWLIEQYLYCVHLFKTRETMETFGRDIKVIMSKKECNFKKLRFTNKIIHYGPGDKKPFYDAYVPLLEEYVNNKERENQPCS